ncbi:MAG: KEOPS complex subunit Bud32 [Promethearchaeota archaeon]|nr:MAG: KEOPS complex subunit Bud32 [Candidatus Lokiarchaeota archaeon]
MQSSIERKQLIKKGAEASLFYGKWFNKEVIFKHRIAKQYRIPQLDNEIRTLRTINEAKALIKVKEYGLNVPVVYEIDTQKALIIMEYIVGEKLKDLMDTLKESDKLNYFRKVGEFIAQLHLNGQTHGDITTSNVLITPNKHVFLIDFGLHEYSDTIEDKSVDLHLFKRVLISSHGNDYLSCYHAFIERYKTIYKNNNSQKLCSSILKNIKVIESRGRYIKKSERL